MVRKLKQTKNITIISLAKFLARVCDTNEEISNAGISVNSVFADAAFNFVKSRKMVLRCRFYTWWQRNSDNIREKTTEYRRILHSSTEEEKCFSSNPVENQADTLRTRKRSKTNNNSARWSLEKPAPVSELREMGVSVLPNNDQENEISEHCQRSTNTSSSSDSMNHRSPTTQSLLCVENVMVTPPEQKSSFIKRRPNRRYSGEDVFAQLSDEIILMIFQWLPKRYLVNCALVCQRWKRISYDESLWYHIDLSGCSLSPDSFAHVLLRNPRILRMVHTEVITPIFQEMVSAMEDFSCHIQYLDLSMADISNTDLAELLSRCNKLRKLFLQKSITDNAVCSSIASNNNLEVLNMFRCLSLDSLGLEDILLNCTELTELSLGYTDLNTECIDVVCKLLNKGIRRLDLSGCDNMKDSHVKELVSRCSCLTALDLSGCRDLTEKCLDPIIAHLCDLQELNLSRWYDILPQMRHSELGMESLQNLLRKLGNMKSLQNLSFFGLHDKEKEVLKGSLPNIKIYEQKLSTIARPIVGIRYTVWGHRVCDFSQIIVRRLGLTFRQIRSKE